MVKVNIPVADEDGDAIWDWNFAESFGPAMYECDSCNHSWPEGTTADEATREIV